MVLLYMVSKGGKLFHGVQLQEHHLAIPKYQLYFNQILFFFCLGVQEGGLKLLGMSERGDFQVVFVMGYHPLHIDPRLKTFLDFLTVSIGSCEIRFVYRGGENTKDTAFVRLFLFEIHILS